MKKLLNILTVLAILFFSINVFAAGTVTETTVTAKSSGGSTVALLVLACTADAAAATFPDTAISSSSLNFLKGWSLAMMVTDPGSTAPTDNYDITLVDQYGVDILGGAGNDRDTSNTEQATPKIGDAYGCRPMDGGTVTLNIDNNAVNSAGITIYLFFVKNPK